MAKNKNNEQVAQLDEQKSPGIFQRLFYWFLIPLMFLLAVVLVVAEISDVNVFEKARETASSLPFISSDESKESAGNADVSSGKVLELQAEIMEKEAQIADLQGQITTANSEKEQMLIEQEKLAFELERLQRESESSSIEFDEVVKAYETMSAKKSAAAIAQLPDAEALRILSNLKTATVAELFEKMEPEKVAHYTTLMTE